MANASAPEVSCAIEPETANIKRARSFVGRFVRDQGYIYPEDAKLLTSEVVTNAIVHAGTEVTLRAVVDGASLRVEVHDDSPLMPRTDLRPDPSDEGGRGMTLIQGIAKDWGVDRVDGDGKILWFTVALTMG